jgi:hypothetical protein
MPIEKEGEQGMFREEREVKSKKTKGAIYGLILGFFIVSIFWFFLYSDYFKIQKIEVGSLAVLGHEAVVGEIGHYFDGPRKWPWGNRNIFFVDTNDLRNYLKAKFFIDDVTVDKFYPNVLRLKIKERQRSVVLVTKNQIYIVDDYGAVSDVADEALVSSTRYALTSPSPYDTAKEILILTSVTTTYAKGQVYTDSTIVRRWLDTANKLRDAGIWFKALDIGSTPQVAISVILKENKTVLMVMDDLLDAQIETLRQYLATKPKLDEVKEYIDVRVPGKIYYK